MTALKLQSHSPNNQTTKSSIPKSFPVKSPAINSIIPLQMEVSPKAPVFKPVLPSLTN